MPVKKLRLRLEYGDQNDSFGQVLPCVGRVDAFVKASDGNEWALYRPDEPVFFAGHTYRHLLLRSRLLGREIGDGTETSVFILLVRSRKKVRDGFKVESFEHIAWGEIVPL